MSDNETQTAQRPRGEITVVEPSRSERILGRRAAETRATVPSLEFSAQASLAAGNLPDASEPRALAGFVASALALTLRDHPRVNAAYRDGHYEYFSRINIGVTLIADGVYATPTLLDADQRDGERLARELAEIETRLAGGEDLHAAETSGATFTLIDLTGYPGISSPPLITAPQAGAISIGLAGPGVAGDVQSQTRLELRVALDNRILWGHDALSFVSDLYSRLAEDHR